MPAMSPSALRESVTLAGCVAITASFGVVADGLGLSAGATTALFVGRGDADGVEVPPVEGNTAGVAAGDDAAVVAAADVLLDGEVEWLGGDVVCDAAGLGFEVGVGE